MKSYLYSDNHKDVYQEVLNQLNSKDCIYGRNLQSYLESSEKGTSPFFKKHLSECSICQTKAQEWGLKMKQIDQLIPYQKLSKRDEELFFAEVSSINDLIIKKIENNSLIKKVNKSDLFLKVLSDLKDAFLSLENIKGLGFGLFSFVLLFLIFK